MSNFICELGDGSRITAVEEGLRFDDPNRRRFVARGLAYEDQREILRNIGSQPQGQANLFGLAGPAIRISWHRERNATVVCVGTADQSESLAPIMITADERCILADM